MSTIVLTGGGTAGHVMAHVAILDKLKQTFDRVCYVGSDGIEKTLMQDKVDYFTIPVVKYNRKFDLNNLLIPKKLAHSVSVATSVLKELAPNVIFSKGGYVSLPVMIAAHRLKIPVITHESDFSLGLTNKLQAKKCDMVLTTFEETSEKLTNGVFVGSPIRTELFNQNKSEALKLFGFTNDKPVLLVFGGSLGSKKINEALDQALIDLLADFQVLHLCGKGNMTNRAIDKGYKRTEYVSDMAKAYSVCDLAVSRAGSNSCCELMALKIPTLFIPLSKKVSRGDQIQNAEYFFKRKMCHILYEENLTSNALVNEIRLLYNDSEGLKKAINNYKHTYANDTIIQILSRYK